MAVDPTTVLAWLRVWPVVRWIGEHIARRSQRPILKLHIDSKRPCAIQSPVTITPSRLSPVDAVSKALSNYYRVQVKNTGPTARGVRVQLTDVWYVDRRIWKRLHSWQAADLPWIGRPTTPTVDLHLQQDELCDVGHVRTNYLQSNVPLPQGERVLLKNEPASRHQALFMLAHALQFLSQPNALDRGHYVLGIRVYADGITPVTAYIDLAFPGRFAVMGDGSLPGPLGEVEVSLRGGPPELYAVDDHPVSEREPRYVPPHPGRHVP